MVGVSSSITVTGFGVEGVDYTLDQMTGNGYVRLTILAPALASFSTALSTSQSTSAVEARVENRVENPAEVSRRIRRLSRSVNSLSYKQTFKWARIKRLRARLDLLQQQRPQPEAVDRVFAKVAGQTFSLGVNPNSPFFQLNTTNGNFPLPQNAVTPGLVRVNAVSEPTSLVTLLCGFGLSLNRRKRRVRRS